MSVENEIIMGELSANTELEGKKKQVMVFSASMPENVFTECVEGIEKQFVAENVEISHFQLDTSEGDDEVEGSRSLAKKLEKLGLTDDNCFQIYEVLKSLTGHARRYCMRKVLNDHDNSNRSDDEVRKYRRVAEEPFCSCYIYVANKDEFSLPIKRLIQGTNTLTWLALCKEYSVGATHVVIETDDQGFVPKGIPEYYMGLASKKFVVSPGWLDECIQKESYVDEEPFEVRGIEGCERPFNISKSSREREKNLFDSFAFLLLKAGGLTDAGWKNYEDYSRMIGDHGGKIFGTNIFALTNKKEFDVNFTVVFPMMIKQTKELLVDRNEQKLARWSTPIISTAWILACVGSMRIVPCNIFLVDTDPKLYMKKKNRGRKGTAPTDGGDTDKASSSGATRKSNRKKTVSKE